MFCGGCGHTGVVEAYCADCVEAINEKEETLTTQRGQLREALRNLIERVTSEVWMGVDEVAFIRHQAKDQIEAAEALL